MSTTTNRGYGFEYTTIKQASYLLNGNIGLETQDWINKTGLVKYSMLTNDEQEGMKRAANRIIAFLLEYEPWLKDEPITVEHVKATGGATDVSDIRLSSSRKSIGISLKSNHDAVKHPRVSPTIDIAQNWLGISTDNEYMVETTEIFQHFNEYSQLNNYTKFKELSKVERDEMLYKPISKAFADLLIRSFNSKDGEVAVRHILPYLIGDRDFYKAKADFRRNELTVAAFDFNGTLGTRKRIHVPTRCLEVRVEKGQRDGMHNYISLNFDRGWEVKMRLHTASTMIENSLKWDVQFVGIPQDAWRSNFRF
ncbi:HaeIII family restriction endonuclease [Priestia megaterium]|uniref:HaeIII family restriction endonuclease n=1 Tax=Priestia megaterium TaxID=1404 RepID=UPI00263AFFC0|nr:HaeIII family restriction endonuclease [Priestia megaterium]MDN4865725.1 HaeIII family restriction endonuclease [Priestia megaterium]